MDYISNENKTVVIEKAEGFATNGAVVTYGKRVVSAKNEKCKAGPEGKQSIRDRLK